MFNELDPHGHLDLYTNKFPLLDKSVIGTELSWRWRGGGGGGGGGPSRVESETNAYRDTIKKGYKNYKNAMDSKKGNDSNMGNSGLHYDRGKKKWNTLKEKTDYEAGHDQNLPEKKKHKKAYVTYSAKHEEDYDNWHNVSVSALNWKNKPYTSASSGSSKDGQYRVYSGWFEVSGNKSQMKNQVKSELKNRLSYAAARQPFDDYSNSYSQYWDQESTNLKRDIDNGTIANNKIDIDNKWNVKKNEIAADINNKNETLNKKNIAKNNAYQKVKDIAQGTRGSDYKDRRTKLAEARKLLSDAGISTSNINSIMGSTNNPKSVSLTGAFKDFYRENKLETWDTRLGSKPPYGEFKPDYYASISPSVLTSWDNANAEDDIDITERYSNNKNTFLWGHYTHTGKAAGKRGNPAEATATADAYKDTTQIKLDKDIEDVKTYQLGVNIDTQTERILNIPYVNDEWEKAKDESKEGYWRKLGKASLLDVKKKDEFGVLFRLSERPEDKQIKLDYNVNMNYGITELENAINEASGEQSIVDVKRFGALTQNVLKDTIAEMKVAKGKEEMLSTMSGFSGFSEIMDMNKTLTNSILGDSGVGGMLSFTSGGKAEESLEKSLRGITGLGNNVTHNWHEWFDEKLKTKYDDSLKLGYTVEEAEKQVAIDGAFAKQYITDYLQPRFDQSKSMDEFVEYLDVRQDEQNPFQTQTRLNAVKLVAEQRAQKYLDDLKINASDNSFNADFYMNPSLGVKDEYNVGAQANRYKTQEDTIAADWNAAKNGDSYWVQQAYRFGIDIKNKEQFARMHYEVKGQTFKDKNGDSAPFDPSADLVNAAKIKDHIYTNILPALNDEALESGTAFGDFITPEEFADDVIKGIDPSDKSGWDEILQSHGLETYKGDFDELREHIMEAFRTGSAQQIREQIKYLNEKRQDPDQQKLGVTYIEREEDYKDEQAKPETELYKVFQKSGFQGSEDEFYNNFFPDVNRSEMRLLTKGGKDDSLESFGLDLSDPFSSLGTIESFFDDDEDKGPSEVDKEKSKSYFTYDVKEDSEWDYRPRKKEKEVLDEFTTMFKGL